MHPHLREMRQVKSSLCVLALCGILLGSSPLLAHHSFAAEYDRNRVVKVTGTVTKFDLSNPHSWIYIEAKDENGVVANWAFESGSAGVLYKRGFRKDTLQPGMVITITGYGAKDNSNTADAQQLTMPDGTVKTLGTENNPG
jgi:DNA/RNA endonuclease YhcR with UshA esterase domain